MSDEHEPNDAIDKPFQAGLVALVFRARKVGINREKFLEFCGHAYDMGERHAPTLEGWLSAGSQLWGAIKEEAARQRGPGGK
jgi:hypothetical protein